MPNTPTDPTIGERLLAMPTWFNVPFASDLGEFVRRSGKFRWYRHATGHSLSAIRRSHTQGD